MKVFLSPLLFLIQLVSLSQTSDDSTNILKWLHATINIECEPSYRREEDRLWRLLGDNKITFEEYRQKTANLNLTRVKGSAIYFLFNKKHYLITARHVLIDTTSIYDTLSFYKNGYDVFQKIFLVEHPQNITKHNIVKADKYGNIVDASHNEDTFIMGISTLNCKLSSPQQDLGILMLDEIYDSKSFIRALEEKGYIPIEIADIDTICNIKTNEKIFAIGYPDESLVLNKWQFLPRALLNWESWGVAIPVISYGEIEANSNDTDYFYGNIFVYLGFSGGPVIRGGKLIGITSRMISETKQFNGSIPNLALIHHSIFIKSSLIIQLLRKAEPSWWDLKNFNPNK